MIDCQLLISKFRNKVNEYFLLSEATFELLKTHIDCIALSRNEILLDYGKTCKDLYFVCQGILIAYFIDKNGSTYNKNIFFENEFAGSMVSAITQKPSEFVIQSLENSLVIKINFSEFKRLISQNDEIKDFYIAYLEKNWVIDKEQREIAIVMQDAIFRYKNLLEKYPKIDRRVPLKHIASHLGITPTQLSRIRKEIL
ncbi:Crp/Fnr family transcriptional regulator [Capnocytophaga cynodegmi]|uniref:Crp/Fnr family transcriptional regulator n=1 Tax=Capnocytophaga cynodegmi TaxID=28189 RepID=UPI00385805A0